jgi:hypothetical protein
MRYEVFLRADRPLDPTQQAKIVELHAEQGGGTDCALYREAQQVLGADLSVAVESAQAAERLCALAFTLTQRLGLAAFDPQLGRPIGEGERELVAARIEQMRAFAQAVPLSPPSAVGTPRARLWLALVFSIVALLLIGRLLLRCAR